jgi:hypothetical protein
MDVLQVPAAIEPRVRSAAAASIAPVTLFAGNAGTLRVLAYQASLDFVAAVLLRRSMAKAMARYRSTMRRVRHDPPAAFRRDRPARERD